MLNTHERRLDADPDRIGALLDAVASPSDALWPADRWPAMVLDRGLSVGSRGGHGAIRYAVESYRPGRSVSFRFAPDAGLVGTHRLEVDGAVLRHVLQSELRGRMRWAWPVLVRPAHDALIEDLLDNAAAALAGRPAVRSRLGPGLRLRLAFLRRLRSAAETGRERPGGRLPATIGAPSAADVVRAFYDASAQRDLERLRSLLDPAVVVEAPTGQAVVGGRHDGGQAALRDLWGRLTEHWEGLRAVVEHLDAVDDRHVLARGAYRGTSRETGRTLDAHFAHVWTVRGGRVEHLQIYSDTAIWNRAWGRSIEGAHPNG